MLPIIVFAKLSQASASALAEISFNFDFPHPPNHPPTPATRESSDLAGNEKKSVIKEQKHKLI